MPRANLRVGEETMEFLFDYLSEYVVIVVLGICLCVGYLIKHSVDFIPNKYIPLIMAVLGVLLNIWVHKGAFSPEILLGGLVSGLASTGLHQLLVHLKEKDQ